MSNNILFFTHTDECTAGDLPQGYTVEVWRPGLIPPGNPAKNFIVWLLFYRLRVFWNRDYWALIVRHGNKVIHSTSVFPGYFRFQFMEKEDVQVGDGWTDPEHQGKGLLTWALRYAVEQSHLQGRRVWALVEEVNSPSIKAVRRTGFKFVGYGSKKRRFGCLILGYYEIEERAR